MVTAATRWLAAGLAWLAFATMLLTSAQPTRAEPLPPGLALVMVEDPGCVYCRKWLAEVGPYYGSSRQGLRAPLVRRGTGDASLQAFGRLVYTPTFLLVRDGRELDRIVGYAGAAEFWRQLQEMLDKSAGEVPSQPERAAPDDRETMNWPPPVEDRLRRMPG